MTKNIAIIQGHPDLQNVHYLHALAEAYAKGASEAGHQIKIINVAGLDFQLLKSKEEFENGEPSKAIREAQETIDWAEHLVILYPLWLGEMPALLKGFLEQLLRPKFVFGRNKTGLGFNKQINGKTAHIIITMGMPAFVYRWFYRAHSLKSFKRNILKFCGITAIKESLIGTIDSKDNSTREKWIMKIHDSGYRFR